MADRAELPGVRMHEDEPQDVESREIAETRRAAEGLRRIAASARCLLWYGEVEVPRVGGLSWRIAVADEEAAQRFFPLEIPPGHTYISALGNVRLPEDRARMRVYGDGEAAAGRDYRQEYRVRNHQGEVRWLVEDVHLEPVGPDRWWVVGVTTDITERKRAELELEARAKREALLSRVGQALLASGDPDAVQGAITAALGAELEADRCFLAVYDGAAGTATVGPDWRRPGLPSLSGVYRFSELDPDPAELYPGRIPLVLEDVRELPGRFAAALEALGLRSIVSVGLFEGGRLVASLNAAMDREPRSWTPEEVEMVQAVAARTRTAVEAARLRKREHDIAERLQEALQPALPGRVPGLDLAEHYRPGLSEANIGGDFYDMFAVEKGCYALVVADLSGKGLAAAAQIATVRHMLRTLLYQRGTTVAQAVTSLNDMLEEHGLLPGFATLFVGTYDVNARTLTYVNAGQEPGLLLRAADGTVEELGTTGPVLGGFGGAEFSEAAVSLTPGDVLALFTDGLTEAGTSRNNLLGMPAVTEIFVASAQDRAASPRAITERLMAGVEAITTPAGIRDDVCLLVARVKDGSGV